MSKGLPKYVVSVIEIFVICLFVIAAIGRALKIPRSAFGQPHYVKSAGHTAGAQPDCDAPATSAYNFLLVQ